MTVKNYDQIKKDNSRRLKEIFFRETNYINMTLKQLYTMDFCSSCQTKTTQSTNININTSKFIKEKENRNKKENEKL